jgi:hypothetical protein
MVWENNSSSSSTLTGDDVSKAIAELNSMKGRLEQSQQGRRKQEAEGRRNRDSLFSFR